MSNSGIPVFRSNYEHNPGVVKAWVSSYPNNPGVMTVWTSNYENNPGVMKIYMTSSEHTPGVQKIYMSGCFPESELVHICSDAYVPIGSLKIGDRISSWDVDRKKLKSTAITGIHKYMVNDIFCFYNSMQVSSTHPIMVVRNRNGILMPKWKVAFDVKVGDYFIGADGRFVMVKTMSRHWHNYGAEVFNLSTDNGVHFLVGNCVVRAENARDSIGFAGTPLTQKLFVSENKKVA